MDDAQSPVPTPPSNAVKAKKINGPLIAALLCCLILVIAYVLVATDDAPRLEAWVGARQKLVGPQNSLITKLSSLGTVLSKGAGASCERLILGYTCTSHAYVDFGTNQNPSEIKRPMIDALHSLGYMADDVPNQTGFENFALYPNARITGDISWDNLVQSNTTLKHLSDASRYKYFFTLSIGIPDTEGQSEDITDFKGNSDPQTIPKINYPSTSLEGTFSYFNQSADNVSYIELSYPPSHYVTSSLCGGSRILDQNNGPVTQSSLPQGMEVTFYTQGPCVSIISVDMQNIAAAAGDNVELDKSAQLSDMGIIACSSSGPPLKDEQAYRVTVGSSSIAYEMVGAQVSRSLCPGFAFYDQNGGKISASQITQDERVTVYHFGNVATKAQVTVGY